MIIEIILFFLYIPHPQPHVPLFASSDFKGSTGKGLYADVVSEIDYSVGRVLKALEDNEVLKIPLLLFLPPIMDLGFHMVKTCWFVWNL